MKFLRYGPKGKEKPGVLDANGDIRDISSMVDDLGGDTVSIAALDRFNHIDLNQLPHVPGTTRIGACLSFVPNFLCIGLNYAQHAEETGMQKPSDHGFRSGRDL